MTNIEIADGPTRWDLSNIYSSLEGDDYRAACAQLETDLAAAERNFDAHGIRRLVEPPKDARDELAGVLTEMIRQANDLARLADTLSSYVYAFFSTDSFDDLAAKEMSKLEVLDARRQKLMVRFQGWIGSLAPRLSELIATGPLLADHAFYLNDMARRSEFLMAEELEALATDLCLDGGVAFGKLQTKVTSQLTVPFERDSKIEQLPITTVRNFCYESDPALRERAYRAEIEGWRSIATTVAACLNAVKGTAQTLELRRGRDAVLDKSLDDNRIDRATLDAMMGAIREAFPTFRRYLSSKARKLGKDQLPWWDLFAPLDASPRKFTWTEARNFIVEKFAAFSDDMSEMAAHAFDSRWIDGEPRTGKAGGAYCMEIMAVEESRILANFNGSYEQVSTLAHELGHGFHNHCQRGLEPLRRGAPMALAETASIFCETLIAEATYKDGTPADQLMVLESQLIGATQVCLDISSRFHFEQAVFDRRSESELSADEFCALMQDAQRETYGEAVDSATYHPYMWLWKPHYYSHDENFYNFPYAFGHLFSLGLYAAFQQADDDFVRNYCQLLHDTGGANATELAARFGIDITKPDFWRKSLAIIEDQVTRYEGL